MPTEVKCSFCNDKSYLTEKNIEKGWGRIKGNIKRKKIDIVHCPKHKDLYFAAITNELAKAPK